MRLGNADRAVCAIAALAAHHESGNARRVSLERYRHHVEHEPGVILKRHRDTRGFREGRLDGLVVAALAVLFLGHLYAPFDLAHGGEILIELCAVRHAEVTA